MAAPNTKPRYFGSGQATPFNIPSNFYAAGPNDPIILRPAMFTAEMQADVPDFYRYLVEKGELRFLTTEHAYQALKAKKDKYIARFCIGGCYSPATEEELTDFYRMVFINGRVPRPEGEVRKTLKAQAKVKARHWAKKNNYGIAAKLASNAKHGRALKIKARHYRYTWDEALPFERVANVWRVLLHAKAAAIPRFVHVLTNEMAVDGPLVEFGRRGEKEVWAGLWDEPRQVVLGQNKMGFLMTEMRDAFRQLPLATVVDAQ